MAYRLGVDVGGTFTDLLLVHEDTGDLARCQEETGLEPPVPQEPLPWAPMESSEEALARVRTHGDRQTTLSE